MSIRPNNERVNNPKTSNEELARGIRDWVTEPKRDVPDKIPLIAGELINRLLSDGAVVLKQGENDLSEYAKLAVQLDVYSHFELQSAIGGKRDGRLFSDMADELNKHIWASLDHKEILELPDHINREIKMQSVRKNRNEQSVRKNRNKPSI